MENATETKRIEKCWRCNGEYEKTKSFQYYCGDECAEAERVERLTKEKLESERKEREEKPLSEVVAGDIVLERQGSTEKESKVIRVTKTLIILEYDRFKKSNGHESGGSYRSGMITGVTLEGLRVFRKKQNIKETYNKLRNEVHDTLKKLEERYNGRYGEASEEKLEKLYKVEVLLKQILETE